MREQADERERSWGDGVQGGLRAASRRAAGVVSARGPGRGWKAVCIAIPGMLFALLGSGALSRSVTGFAWALVVYVLILIGLLASELRRWIKSGYFGRDGLLPVLVAGGFAETLLAGAILADALVERDPVALVISVPVLLVFMIAGDLTVSARIIHSEAPSSNESQGDEDRDDDEDEDDDGLELYDWGEDAEAPADTAESASETLDVPPAAGGHASVSTVVDLVRLALFGAEWIAPVAVIGVVGVCVAVAIGGVPKGTVTAPPGVSAKTVVKGSAGKSGGSGGKGGEGGKGGSGGSGDSGSKTPPTPWNGPCTEETRGRVSELAFERMAGLFESVDLEPSVEGCISELEGHPYRDDYYVTAVGIEQPTGEPLSFAVQSERCGGALVLNVARKAVEEVMTKAGPVCGVGPYPRYRVKDSDYYYLRSPHGVWIVFRRSQTDEYEIMPPGLVRTWYQAMLAVGTWLWPSPPRRLGHHILRYEMWSYRNTERAELIVKFNKRTGTGSYPGQSFPADPKFEPLRGKLLNLAEES
jgi:hypothetical protein